MPFFSRKPTVEEKATQTECEFTCTQDKKEKRDVWWYLKQAKRIMDVLKLVRSCVELVSEDSLDLGKKVMKRTIEWSPPFHKQLLLAASAA